MELNEEVLIKNRMQATSNAQNPSGPYMKKYIKYKIFLSNYSKFETRLYDYQIYH